jgi:hypothetical protein
MFAGSHDSDSKMRVPDRRRTCTESLRNDTRLQILWTSGTSQSLTWTVKPTLRCEG